MAKTPGAVSVQQIDQDKAAVDEADAAVKAFQASLEVYKLNLSFTRVTSPIDGQVSRYFMTLGNLVVQDQTLLTTVVSLDPMYVYFDVDEGTVLRVRKAINEGTIKRYQEGGIPLFMALQNEANFPHKGTRQLHQQPGEPQYGQPLGARPLCKSQARARASARFRRACSCGCGCRSAKPHPAILVIDQAIASDQGLKFVYVIDAKNQVQSTPRIDRRAARGRSASHHRGIEGRRLGGHRRVAATPATPNKPITPKEVPMPSYGQPERGRLAGRQRNRTTRRRQSPAAPTRPRTGGQPKQ